MGDRVGTIGIEGFWGYERSSKLARGAKFLRDEGHRGSQGELGTGG